jgi:uncharacterized protein with GYD domain
MATLILLSSLTEAGARTLKDNPERVRAVNRELEGMGVRVTQQWAVLGPYDFVNVVEAPDTRAIARVSAELASRGSVRVLTLAALPLDAFIASFPGPTGRATKAAPEPTPASMQPAPPRTRSPAPGQRRAARMPASAQPTASPERPARTRRAALANPIQVQTHLKGVDYPAGKRDLVEAARREGASQTVLRTLERLPDRTYDGPTGVAEEIGRLT